MNHEPQTSLPLLLDDEWKAPPPSRVRIAAIGAVIGIVLLATCVELFRNREQMWEPENESVWVPLATVPATLSPDTDVLIEPVSAPLPAPPAPRQVVRTTRRPVQAARAPGYLSINSSPWAELSVDERVIGTTPQIKIRVTAGRHHLLLVRAGFQIHSAWVNVPAGATVRLTDITLSEIGQ